MGSFRRIFGVVCFVYAGAALLWFFDLANVRARIDTNVVVAGFLVITVASLVIDAVVARQERQTSEGTAGD